MAKVSDARKKFVTRTRKKRPTGVKLVRLGKVFKMKKYKAPGA